jgi:hypothetical protein
MSATKSSNTPDNRKGLYGAAAMMIAWLLTFFQVDVAAAEIEAVIGQAVEAIQVLLGVGGFAMTVWNQWKKRPAAAEKAADE